MRDIRVATVQFQHAAGDKAYNFGRIRHFVTEAARAARARVELRGGIVGRPVRTGQALPFSRNCFNPASIDPQFFSECSRALSVGLLS